MFYIALFGENIEEEKKVATVNSLIIANMGYRQL